MPRGAAQNANSSEDGVDDGLNLKLPKSSRSLAQALPRSKLKELSGAAASLDLRPAVASLMDELHASLSDDTDVEELIVAPQKRKGQLQGHTVSVGIALARTHNDLQRCPSLQDTAPRGLSAGATSFQTIPDNIDLPRDANPAVVLDRIKDFGSDLLLALGKFDIDFSIKSCLLMRKKPERFFKAVATNLDIPIPQLRDVRETSV